MPSFVLLLVLLLLLLAGTAVAARGPVPALPRRLTTVHEATARWRRRGLAIGVLGAVAVTSAGTLGRGLMLAAPLLALCVLLGVAIGELRVTVPAVAERVAVLEVRRVRDYVPQPLGRIVLAATGLLGLLLLTTTALGSSDDMGRAGRALFRQCSAAMSESRGPWPGSYYSVPLVLVVGLGLLVAAYALHQVVLRPRQGDDVAADDVLRRAAAASVTAAAGLLVAVPLLGVAVTAGTRLLGISCRPPAWTVLGAGLLLLLPALLGLVAWCSGLLFGPARVPAAAER